MEQNILVLLPQLLLIGFAFAVLLVDTAGRERGRRALSTWAVALVGALAVVTAVVVLPFWVRQGEFWGGMWLLDPFSLFFQVLLSCALILVLLESAEFVRARRLESGIFYALLLLATTGMTIMASSRELLTIYVGLELTSVSFYALVGAMKEDPRSNEAAIKYFLMGAASSAVLLFGISLLYGLAGSTYLPEAARRVVDSPLGWAAAALVLVGLGFKVAAVPFHMWTPDAYQGAPTPITAYLSVGSKAAAFAALLRVFVVGFPAIAEVWQMVFAVVAILTMTYGNVTALAQTDVKRMMGYSSIAHAGYVLTGLAVFTPESLSATLYYLLAYVFANLGVFAVIILVSARRGGEEVTRFRGLGRESPAYAIAITLFFLSLVGIPPTAGFFGKFYLFYAAIHTGYTWLAVVMVINSVLSLPYYYSVVREMWLEPAQEPELQEQELKGAKPAPEPESPAGYGILGIGPAVAASALMVLLLGLYPQPFIDWARQVAVLL